MMVVVVVVVMVVMGHLGGDGVSDIFYEQDAERSISIFSSAS